MGAKSTGNHPTTTKADGHLLEYFRNSFGEGGGGTQFVAPPGNQGIEATGGTISDYTQNGTHYRAHIFTTSGSFNVSAVEDGNVEYLVVAGGGGGGGGYYGGGGGDVNSTSGSEGYSGGGGGGSGYGHPTKMTSFTLTAGDLSGPPEGSYYVSPYGKGSAFGDGYGGRIYMRRV